MPAKSKVQFIMVHCAATLPEWMAGQSLAAKVAEIRRWHVEDRGWTDIAYARIIDRDGLTANGRDLDRDGDVWEEVGAGAKGWNHNCVHLCLLGGHGSSATDEFSEHFTPEQDAALRAEIAAIRAWAGWEVPLKGHNEVANKACPGFNVARWFAGQPPRQLAESSTLRASFSGAAAAVGAGGTALAGLDGLAQLVVLVFLGLALLAFLWIARERIRKWAAGVH